MFFEKAEKLSLADVLQLASFENADALKEQAGGIFFTDVKALTEAGSEDIAFHHNEKYKSQITDCRAGACIVHPKHKDLLPQNVLPLLTSTPQRAFAAISQAFYPEEIHGTQELIHPTAVIHPTAELGKGTRVGHHVYIGPYVRIGELCRIDAGAVIVHTHMGAKCHVYTGARIGQAGFGFAMDEKGPLNIPQIGRVIIGNQVDIGANTTIDRGSLRDTVIGDGTRIDNLVQIGHNVQIGKGCIIVSQVGIAGSTILEDYVALGGQVGVSGHLHLKKGAQAAAKSGIMRDIEPGQTVGGIPAVPIRQWHQQNSKLGQLAKTRRVQGDKREG